MSDEKVKAVEAEVQRLQDAQVIREVKYPVWLANTVPVKKKNSHKYQVGKTLFTRPNIGNSDGTRV
jgi:hypothetical protein